MHFNHIIKNDIALLIDKMGVSALFCYYKNAFYFLTMDCIKLEISSFSYKDCLNAKIGGANRVELCNSYQDAGTTPSYGLVRQVKESLDIQVYPIVRPRGGNFVYSKDEFQIMINDIEIFKSLQCDGIAVGVLLDNGNVDIEKMKKLVDVACPMGVTFIRSFDLVPDAFQALDDLIACGCERVLTSGQASFVSEGLPLVKQLVDYADNKISIMAGSGVRTKNVEEIIKETSVKEVHTSARIKDQDTSNIKTGRFDFGHQITNDLDQIKKIRHIIDNFS